VTALEDLLRRMTDQQRRGLRRMGEDLQRRGDGVDSHGRPGGGSASYAVLYAASLDLARIVESEEAALLEHRLEHIRTVGWRDVGDPGYCEPLSDTE
jgi:hypothetical protein